MQKARGRAYKSVTIGSSTVKKENTPVRDNCILLKSGEVAIVTDIHEDNLLVKIFRDKNPLFLSPINSCSIGIYLVSNLNIIKYVPVSKVHCKLIIVSKGSSYVATKLLHNSHD